MRIAWILAALALPLRVAAQTPIPADAAKAAHGRAAPADQLGSRQATVVVEEYGDFQCPFCAAHELQYGAALDRWVRGQHPDVRFDFYDLALPQHPFASAAARGARCAGAQGSFAAARHAIYAAQEEWTAAPDPAARVEELVRGLVRDSTRYLRCLAQDSAAASATIAANLERARAVGVTGTPTFVIRVGDRSAQIVRAASPDSIAHMIWQLRNGQP